MEKPTDAKILGERPCICGAQVLHVRFRGITYWRCENAATTCDAFGKTYEEALRHAHEGLETAALSVETIHASAATPEASTVEIYHAPHAPSANSLSVLHAMTEMPIEDLAIGEDLSLLHDVFEHAASDLCSTDSAEETCAALTRAIKSAFVLGRWSARRLG